MLRYVENRGDAQTIPVPGELRQARVVMDGKDIALTEADYPVILTLRHKGLPVARCVRQGAGLVENVIAAALQAMRGPSLPDRVSRAYLASLTIELEIVGRFTPVEEDRIGDDLQPGLDGLKLTVGVDDPKLQGPHFQDVYQEAIVSPAVACVLGWDAPRMKRQCLTEIRWRPENQSLRRQWSRFATLHYIAYPDTPAAGMPTGTWLLYRGKILSPPLSAGDVSARLEVARQVGDFLRRHQEPSGQYVLPGGKASTAQQLHAAWAMAKLGKALKDGKAYTDSAKAVLGYVAKQYVKLDPDGKQACVFTVDPREEVLATALFLLAAAEDSRSQAGRDIEANMLAFLRSRMDEEGHFLDADGKRLDDVSSAVALLAMQTVAPNPSDAQWRDGVEAMLYDAGEMGTDDGKHQSLSAVGEAWLGRAILAGRCGADGQYRNFVSRFAGRTLQRQRRDGSPDDEVGAICTPAGRAETVPTALAVVLLHQALQGGGIAPDRQEADRLSAAITAGQTFCRQMLYRTEEAYFTPNSAARRGGVRREAESADVSLDACAGALEALLVK